MSERHDGKLSSLGQGLALLDAAVRRERSGRPGLSVSGLAAATGLDGSRVSRLTHELLDLGLFEKSGDGRLRVGPAYFSLGASRQDAWLVGARQELRALASRARASVRVVAADGPRAVLLRFESGSGAPGSAVQPGMVTPIWSTAGGRALLWDAGAAEVAGLLAESRFIGVGGPSAAKSSADVVARVAADRARGVVEAVEEFEHGVVELAAPVRAGARIVAAVSAACHVDDTGTRDALRRDVVALALRLGAIADAGSAGPEQ